MEGGGGEKLTSCHTPCGLYGNKCGVRVGGGGGGRDGRSGATKIDVISTRTRSSRLRDRAHGRVWGEEGWGVGTAMPSICGLEIPRSVGGGLWWPEYIVVG